VDAVAVALEHAQAALPPVVLTELLSDPKVSASVRDLFTQLPVLEVRDGFWQRAGLLRSRLIVRGLRARLADTLIAQSCLDHELPLVTRDSDFRHFVRLAGVRLARGSRSG
jgi:predicted nucleic acid-binding protein